MKNKKVKQLLLGILAVTVVSTCMTVPSYAWEYLGVQIPDYLDQETIMQQINNGNEDIINELCTRYGACEVKEPVDPGVPDISEPVDSSHQEFDENIGKEQEKEPDTYTTSDLNHLLQGEKSDQKEGTTDDSDSLNGLLTEIMDSLYQKNITSVQNYTENDNIYLKWLKNYSTKGLQVGYSEYEMDAYSDFIAIANIYQSMVKKQYAGVETTFQYKIGDGYYDTGIYTVANGILSGLQVEEIYECVARHTDAKFSTTGVGSALTVGEDTFVALKTSMYNTDDVINNLNVAGIKATVRNTRLKGNYRITEYVESLKDGEQKIYVQTEDETLKEVKALTYDSITLVNVKELAEALGGSYSVSGNGFTISKDGSYCSGTENSKTISMSNSKAGINTQGNIKAPVLKYQGEFYVSAYSAVNGLGYLPVWDSGIHGITLEVSEK